MQIIIPMSGYGERFRKAGYHLPKPLIEVDGQPMIAHVVQLFSPEDHFVFICNQEHLDAPEYNMEAILCRYAPSSKIIGISPHKLGPVHAVMQAAEIIDRQDSCIVNYCDFSCNWDYEDFKRYVVEKNCEGAVVAYRGFHPHSLGSTYYAYIKERNGYLEDIQEKRPFTSNPMSEFASSGTYYFKSVERMIHYFQQIVEQNLHVNGEYYVSLAYKVMAQERQLIGVYEIPHFMQWGTPDDLAEYQQASNLFTALKRAKFEPAYHKGTVMIPMAGEGSRFQVKGYALPKPLIPVLEQPMVIRARQYLPQAEQVLLITRHYLPNLAEFRDTLICDKNSHIVELDQHTDGQARTCLLALNHVNRCLPLTIAACDSTVLYDYKSFERLLQEEDTDVVVWATRSHVNASRCPHMYGWLETECGYIRSVSVKKPLKDPKNDPIVVGIFTFKHAMDFEKSVRHMIAREGRVNGEFYIDEAINDAINIGLRCKIFEVEHYISWGTPNELETFHYWHSCFSKYHLHPFYGKSLK